MTTLGAPASAMAGAPAPAMAEVLAPAPASAAAWAEALAAATDTASAPAAAAETAPASAPAPASDTAMASATALAQETAPALATAPATETAGATICRSRPMRRPEGTWGFGLDDCDGDGSGWGYTACLLVATWSSDIQTRWTDGKPARSAGGAPCARWCRSTASAHTARRTARCGSI